MGFVRTLFKIVFYLLSIILTTFGVFFFLRYLESGEQKTLVFHNDFGPCYRLKGAFGVEDIAINKKGFAFLSASDKRKVQMENTPDPNAGIFGLDLTKISKEELSKLSSEGSTKWIRKIELVGFPPNLNFHPHGISLWEEESTSKEFLFVVNHHLGLISSIEIFEYKDEKLYFLKHIEDKLIVSINDIAATSPHSFVATNDFKYANAVWRVIEIMGKLCMGNVIEFDGNKTRILLPNKCYPNGINYRNGFLFLTESVEKVLDIFSWKLGDEEAILKKQIYLGSNLDNIDFAQEEEQDPNKFIIYTTGHPKGFTFLLHLIAGTKTPSQVLKVEIDKELKEESQKEVMALEGNLESKDDIPGASVAALYKKYLLLGSPVDFDGILVCLK